MAPQRRRPRGATDERAADEEERADEQQPKVRRRAATRRQPAEDSQPADDSQPSDDSQPADDSEHQDEASAEDHSPADADGGGSIRTARQAVRAALREILDLTAKEPESIVGVQRTQDGWSVCFEVVEDRRIPSSADILASYEAKIDADGELTSFRRIRRYGRGRGDGNGGGR